MIRIATAAAVAALTAGLAGTEAKAATLFAFSYDSALGTLSGIIEGELQTDDNTVFVDAVSDVAFDGTDLPATPFVDAVSNVVFGVDGQASVTVDGSAQNLFACTDNTCADGFLIDTTGAFGVPLIESSPDFGDLVEIYDPAFWSLDELDVDTVPLPASALLLLSGLGALALGRRRA